VLDLGSPMLRDRSLDRQSVNAALERVGVKSALDQIPWDEVYRLLLELSDGSRDVAVVRSFYRAISMRIADDAPEIGSASRRAFMEHGKLLAKRRDRYEYLPVAEVRYDHTGALPPAVARELALLDIDPKRGADKIKTQFGVDRVEAGAVKVTVTDAVRSARADELAEEVNRLKKYVLVLETDLSEAQVARLRDATIDVCERISGKVSVAGGAIEFELSKTGDLVVDGAHAYVVGEVTFRGLESDVLLAGTVTDAMAAVLDVDGLPAFARVAPCSPETRDSLVAHILRIDADTLAQRLDLKDRRLWGADAPSSVALPSYPPEPELDVKTPDQPPQAPPTAPTPDAPSPVPPVVPAPVPPAADLQVTQEPHQPTPPRRIDFRVRRQAPGAPPLPARARLVLDYRRCEKLVEAFEEKERRFPIYVGHAQGRKAYGCDVLSFDTEERRTAFEKTQDRSLIDRWIEVKGRTRDTACILLGGNELRTAEQQTRKAYLYRVYEVAPNEFRVLVLSNPAGRATGKILEVDLKQRAETEAYTVEYVVEDQGSGSGRK
jgi:hypothetical protein